MSATAWSVAHASAIDAHQSETLLRSSCGRVISLPSGRWWSAPPVEEERVLDLAIAPVLDLGCGPGRHAAALARRGVLVLGVDSSVAAAAAARSRGVIVVCRSLFDRLPDEGRWGSALLLDGNVGIGGDPVRLLRRTRSLLRAGGRTILEVEGPGVPTASLHVRAEVPRDSATEWFPWAQVGVDDLESIGRSAGFLPCEPWSDRGRWFACLEAS